VSEGVNLADRWLEDYSLGATGQGLGCERERWAQKGVWAPLLCSQPRTATRKGVFKDDVLVSGLKMTPPACRGRLCLCSPGRRRKANKGPTGVRKVAFSGSESPAAACKCTPCPSFRNALSNTSKGTGSCLDGVDRSQQTCVQNTAQDYFYQEIRKTY
jgi:hypothetical protein